VVLAGEEKWRGASGAVTDTPRVPAKPELQGPKEEQHGNRISGDLH